MSQIICRISGEKLYKSDLLLGFDLEDIHPVFKAKKSLILKPDWMFKFQNAKSIREKKLYYLSALNTTDLIDWNHPAEPTSYTMEYSMFQVMTIASWIDYAKHGIQERIQFPRYIVGRENFQLAEIPIWLDEINEIKNIFLRRDREDSRKKQLNEQSQKIEIEFRKAGLIGQAFTLPLASWALDLAGVPEGMSPRRVLEILQTPLDEAWCYSTENEHNELVEIYEHLQSELPVSNDQCLAVRVQMRKLIEATKWGYSASGEELEDEEGNPIPAQPVKAKKSAGYQILVDEQEIENPVNYPIPPEPKRGDFDKTWEYFAAKAKWELTKSALTKQSGEWKQF